jgi:hypothetical protein
MPLPEDSAVLVLDANKALPDGCREIGKIKADAGGAECHYSTVIANAKDQARKMGGNVIKITRYWEPGAFVGEPVLGLIAKGPGEVSYELIKD